jgi:hypothetical protein
MISLFLDFLTKWVLQLDRRQSPGTRGSLVHPRGYRGQSQPGTHLRN